jgi:hypothetical protein
MVGADARLKIARRPAAIVEAPAWRLETGGPAALMRRC